MPNIIEEIIREKARVKEMIPFLNSMLRYEAEKAVRLCDIAMASNSPEDMKKSLDHLRLFTKDTRTGEK